MRLKMAACGCSRLCVTAARSQRSLPTISICVESSQIACRVSGQQGGQGKVFRVAVSACLQMLSVSLKEVDYSRVMRLAPASCTPLILSASLLMQDTILSTVQDWAQEPSYRSNATVLLVIGLIYAAEDNYVEALRACHTGISLEL